MGGSPAGGMGMSGGMGGKGAGGGGAPMGGGMGGGGMPMGGMGGGMGVGPPGGGGGGGMPIKTSMGPGSPGSGPMPGMQPGAMGRPGGAAPGGGPGGPQGSPQGPGGGQGGPQGPGGGGMTRPPAMSGAGAPQGPGAMMRSQMGRTPPSMAPTPGGGQGGSPMQRMGQGQPPGQGGPMQRLAAMTGQGGAGGGGQSLNLIPGAEAPLGGKPGQNFSPRRQQGPGGGDSPLNLPQLNVSGAAPMSPRRLMSQPGQGRGPSGPNSIGGGREAQGGQRIGGPMGSALDRMGVQPQGATPGSGQAGRITDISGSHAPFRNSGQMRGDPLGMIVHHTSGGGDVNSLVSGLQGRNLGVQFGVDRNANIFRLAPEGSRQSHAGAPSKEFQQSHPGVDQSRLLGVEVIAPNNKSVTPAQRDATKWLVENQAAKYGFNPGTDVWGHGEYAGGRKEADEGMSTVNALRGSGTSPQAVAGIEKKALGQDGAAQAARMQPQQGGGFSPRRAGSGPQLQTPQGGGQRMQQGKGVQDPTKFTHYHPGEGDTKMQGGNELAYAKHQPYRYGDYKSGKAPYVSVAGDPSRAGTTGHVEMKDGSKFPVKFEDTGSAFKGRLDKMDIAAYGKDKFKDENVQRFIPGPHGDVPTQTGGSGQKVSPATPSPGQKGSWGPESAAPHPNWRTDAGGRPDYAAMQQARQGAPASAATGAPPSPIPPGDPRQGGGGFSPRAQAESLQGRPPGVGGAGGINLPPGMGQLPGSPPPGWNPAQQMAGRAGPPPGPGAGLPPMGQIPQGGGMADRMGINDIGRGMPPPAPQTGGQGLAQGLGIDAIGRGAPASVRPPVGQGGLPPGWNPGQQMAGRAGPPAGPGAGLPPMGRIPQSGGAPGQQPVPMPPSRPPGAPGAQPTPMPQLRPPGAPGAQQIPMPQPRPPGAPGAQGPGAQMPASDMAQRAMQNNPNTTPEQLLHTLHANRDRMHPEDRAKLDHVMRAYKREKQGLPVEGNRKGGQKGGQQKKAQKDRGRNQGGNQKEDRDEKQKKDRREDKIQVRHQFPSLRAQKYAPLRPQYQQQQPLYGTPQ